MATRKTTPKAAFATDAAVAHAQHLAKLVHVVRHEKVLFDTDPSSMA